MYFDNSETKRSHFADGVTKVERTILTNKRGRGPSKETCRPLVNVLNLFVILNELNGVLRRSAFFLPSNALLIISQCRSTNFADKVHVCMNTRTNSGLKLFCCFFYVTNFAFGNFKLEIAKKNRIHSHAVFCRFISVFQRYHASVDVSFISFGILYCRSEHCDPAFLGTDVLVFVILV